MLLAAAAGAMTWLAVYQVDDAFIVYRYARNFAQGAGFVFNPGERVEGVTCFLWTVLLAPFAAIGLDLPRVAPVLTGVCGLATIALTARRHAEAEGRTSLAPRDLVPALLLASTPSFLYWSVGGLETVPFALLVMLTVRDHARMRSAIWLGLASLTRPETPVVVGALALDRLLRGTDRRALARWLAVVAALFVPFLLVRRLYFDAWLPNTYFAKTGAPLAVRATAGWSYLQEAAGSLVPAFGWKGWLVATLGLIVIAGLSVFALGSPRLRPEGLVVIALAAACVFEGGDWMVLHRFLVPALPPLAVLAGAALLRAAGGLRDRRWAASAVGLACVAHGILTAVEERNGGRGLRVQGEGYRHAHREIAAYLAEHGARGEAVALMDVGMIGWYAPQLVVIDITGLTDREVARAPGGFLNKRYPVERLLAREPRFFVLVPGFPADDRIHDDPAFQARYRLRFALNHRFNWEPPSQYNLHVFEKGPA
jgi:hypothetical protein